jgi:putative heme-binding domain-containing protein
MMGMALSVHVGMWSVQGHLQAEDPPFSVPDGFHVQQVADDALAHDCFCMTIDATGRPILSGPGYLRTLIDENGDGVFDRSIDWSREVKQGAQGLWLDGKTLYWVSDGGLWRSEDTDGDSVANARAQRVLELPTGGEHDSHAIKRGPDGFWYLIAGNFASNVGRLANDSSAPIGRSRAGTLWRMSPDFARRGVWAHGLRNGYDFDFLPDGQVVTYDSDDEREATLPWYRPTRVFVMGPGSDGGWCGATAKDDDYRVTMPLVLGRLGRGSPTGVVTYEHTRFPERYRDAIFVLDWTFGRILAIYPTGNLPPDERIPDKIPSEIFMETTGTAGFAPTAACVAPDGSLLVCVGGRGTAGAIYRVSYTPDSPSLAPHAGDPLPDCFATALEKKQVGAEDAKVLESILKAPAPWSAWSIAQWRPRVSPRIRDHLVQLAIGRLPIDGPSDRTGRLLLRSAQILTHLGEPVSTELVQQACASSDPKVRIAGWWLASRQRFPTRQAPPYPLIKNPPTGTENEVGTRWSTHLGSDEDRMRWEAIGLNRWPMPATDSPSFSSTPAGQSLRRTWLWAMSRVDPRSGGTSGADPLDPLIARQLFGTDTKLANRTLLEQISQRWGQERDTLSQRELMESLTSMQASLGDRRLAFPLQTDLPADASDGYRGLYTQQLSQSSRNNIARWALYFATTSKKRGWDAVHAESVRTMAMMEPSEPQCMRYILDQITSESHPTSDLHMLCSLAQCNAVRTPTETAKTASSLSELVSKVKGRGLYTDNQWPIRLQQLVARLLERDNPLGDAFLATTTPRCQEDLVLLSAFPVSIQDRAREKIRALLKSSPPEEWTETLVQFAATGPMDEAFRAVMKKGCEVDSLRQSCLGYLARAPQASDYELYLHAIEESERSLWSDAWRGISALEIRDPGREFPAIAKLVSAAWNSGLAIPKPAVADRLRRVAAVSDRPAPPSTEAWSEWSLYWQSQLDEAQLASLISPRTQVDIAGVVESIGERKGNADRGEALFRSKCALCHGGQSALGPSLSGVAKRFSREDLAIAIFEPSRDVSDRYRAVRIRTIDDEVVTGMSIYSAADGVSLQSPDGTILRINQDQIAERAYSTESLMPAGLLEDRSEQDVADLFAYLGTL